MVVLVVLVTTGLTVRINVATESQPVEEVSVSFISTSCSNINTVPCVRQCTRTDGSVGSACYDWVAL
jgi:hypothetical protein